MKKKECPSCAMEVDSNSTTCPICGYEFTDTNKLWLKWIALLLILLFLLMLLFQL